MGRIGDGECLIVNTVCYGEGNIALFAVAAEIIGSFSDEVISGYAENDPVDGLESKSLVVDVNDFS